MRAIRPSFVMPALFTSTSTVPKRTFTAFTISSHAAKSETLAIKHSASTPNDSHAAFTSRPPFCTSASERQFTAMLKPSFARRFAMHAPIPCDAPVINAVFLII